MQISALRPLVSGLFLIFSASIASAVTLSFTGGSYDPTFTQYTQNGIRASALPDQWGATDIMQGGHIEAGGGYAPWAIGIDLVSGQRFDAVSIDLIAVTYGFNYYDPVSYAYTGLCTLECPDVLLQGIRGGAVVATAAVNSYATDTFLFPGGFSDLDSLTVSYNFAWQTSMPVDNVSGEWHFEFDNVQISPVPLPAAAAPFALVLAGVAGVALRRRRAAARG